MFQIFFRLDTENTCFPDRYLSLLTLLKSLKENKLTISPEQIDELRKRIQATETKTQIAKDLNISRYSLPEKTSLSR